MSSTTSSSSSSSSPSTMSDTIASSSSATSFASIPLHHAVTIRLNLKNFLLWRTQLLPYLRSTKLLGHVDGSTPAPPKLVAASTAAGAAMVPNPAYDRWVAEDQHLLSGLLSSMTEDVLRDLTSVDTAKGVWDALNSKFASSTRARIVQIRVELATAKKRDSSVPVYFARIKGLAAEMAAAGAPLQEDEVLSYLFAGLGADYDAFVTSMTMKTDPVSLDDVFVHLMAYEARQQQHHGELQLNIGASANFAGRGGRGGRGRGRGRGDRGRGRSAPDHGATSRPAGGRGQPRPMCQICGKIGHTAIRCWYRMDEAYNEDPLPQGPPAGQPAAMTAAVNNKIDPNWYLDTGATDHITSDLDRLALRERYHGSDQVHVGNGTGSSHEEKSTSREM